MSARPFEIVLWGATGFTGQLVAEYLSTAPSARGLRWAIAGRNEIKLAQVKRDLGAEVGMIVANADDPQSLARLAESAQVVCTTVGPYMKYGAGLVEACVNAGTHYCDLTGEVPFIRQMIDRHHERAVESGARIVHCCGFDSIPSDLGVLMMHRAMQDRCLELASVDAFYGESKGAFSGGTVASLLGVIDAARSDRSVLKVVGDPYGLDPKPRQGGPDGSDQKGVGYDKRIGRFTAPFLMAAINTRVVRRTNAVTGYRYGRDFRYSEKMSFGSGPLGLAAASAVTAALTGLVVGSQLPVVRPWLESKLPKPGQGPSRARRQAGRFVLHLLAESRGAGGEVIHGKVAHDLDPGYGSTKVMLAESALCLARDTLESGGGVLTPGSALGEPLIERLRSAGMTWSVGQAPSADAAFA